MNSSDRPVLTRDIEYKIVRSKRRTLSIHVSPDKGVIIRAPLRLPLHEIQRFAREKSGWINKCLDSFSSLRKIDNEMPSDGSRLLFEGKELTLRILHSDKNYVTLNGEGIIEVGTKHNNDPAVIHTILESWFKYSARRRLTQMFGEITSRYQGYSLRPAVFTVSRMKKRWGSCSVSGKIAVSYDLIKLDPVFSEYVIIHELCHLRHHNHGAGFYELLTELYPEWKRVRKELRRYIR